jgi:hypothetical protein
MDAAVRTSLRAAVIARCRGINANGSCKASPWLSRALPFQSKSERLLAAVGRSSILGIIARSREEEESGLSFIAVSD